MGNAGSRGDHVRVHFFRDGAVNRYEAEGGALDPLGSLLTGDVMNSATSCLDLLEAIDLVRDGSAAHRDWEGNGWSGRIRPDGLHLADLHSDDWWGDYTLDDAREVTLDYLRFLLPDVAARAAALSRWERTGGRPHPARTDIQTSMTRPHVTAGGK